VKYFECLIPAKLVTDDWQGCAAFRFITVDVEDGQDREQVEIAGAVVMEVKRPSEGAE
jgi:hypothetical protein